MRKRIITASTLMLLISALLLPTAAMAAGDAALPVVSFAAASQTRYGGSECNITVEANAPVGADLAVSIMRGTEKLEVTIPTGEQKASLTVRTEAVTETSNLKYTIAAADGYVVGKTAAHTVKLTVMPAFDFYENVFTARAGKECRVIVDSKTPKRVHTDVPLSIRTEDDVVLHSFKYNKARDYSFISFTAPKKYDPQGKIYLYNDLNGERLDSIGIALIVEGQNMIHNVEREGMIAISFDCAYGAQYTNFILDTLDKYDAKATFFMTSNWAHAHKEKAAEIVKRGHEVGNHTVNHKDLNTLETKDVVWEIDRANDIIEESSGMRPIVLRPPFGRCNASVYAIARYCGVEVVRWSDDAEDYEIDYNIDASIRRATEKAAAGDIVLFHNSATHIRETLDACLQDYTDKGLKIVSVSELLLDSPSIVNEKGRQLLDPSYTRVTAAELLAGYAPEIPVENADVAELPGGMLPLEVELPDETFVLPAERAQAIISGSERLTEEFSIGDVSAPIAQGELIGQAVFSLDGEELFSANLTASRSVSTAAPGAENAPSDSDKAGADSDEPEDGGCLSLALTLNGVLVLAVIAAIILLRKRRGAAHSGS